MSTLAGPTPGPWRWDNSAGVARLIQEETLAPVFAAIPGICASLPTVAVNSQEWDGPPYQLREATAGDANAALIAAAPDLLDMCRLALKQLGPINDAHQREHRSDHPTLSLLIDSLQAVIEKAEGAAPC